MGLFHLNICFNCPYRGSGDGVGTAMHVWLPPDRHAGSEVGINKALLGEPRSRAAMVRTSIYLAVHGKSPKW